MTWRTLVIELRRSPMLSMLPLAVVLCVVILVSEHLRPVALWVGRTLDLQFTMEVLGPVVAGVAAWVASRDARRDMRDLVATTSLPLRRRALTGWAATTALASAFYLVLIVPALVVTAVQVTWGPVVLWPVVVALASVPVCAALGHLVGARLPGRLVAPLTTVTLFACLALGTSLGERGTRLAWLDPIYPTISPSDGVFWPARSELAVVQLLFLAGLLATTLSLTGPRLVRRRALPVTASGLAAVVAAGVLAWTGHQDSRGITIPALHDTATDHTVPYQPVCRDGRIVVCVHPAYTDELGTISLAVNKIAAPVLGLPGVPQRLRQALPEATPGTTDGVISIPMPTLHGAMPDLIADWFASVTAQALVTPSPHPTPAQQAIAQYLVEAAGYTPDPHVLPHDHHTDAAAARLAARTPAEQHRWLATHLPAVRAGAEVLP